MYLLLPSNNQIYLPLARKHTGWEWPASWRQSRIHTQACAVKAATVSPHQLSILAQTLICCLSGAWATYPNWSLESSSHGDSWPLHALSVYARAQTLGFGFSIHLRVYVHPSQTGSTIFIISGTSKNCGSWMEKTEAPEHQHTYGLLRFFVVTVLPGFATSNRTVALSDLILDRIKYTIVFLKKATKDM